MVSAMRTSSSTTRMRGAAPQRRASASAASERGRIFLGGSLLNKTGVMPGPWVLPEVFRKCTSKEPLTARKYPEAKDGAADAANGQTIEFPEASLLEKLRVWRFWEQIFGSGAEKYTEDSTCRTG